MRLSAFHVAPQTITEQTADCGYHRCRPCRRGFDGYRQSYPRHAGTSETGDTRCRDGRGRIHRLHAESGRTPVARPQVDDGDGDRTDGRQPVLSEVIRGIDSALSNAGYGLIIGNLDNKREREQHFVDLAFAGQVDGVMLLNGWMPSKDERSLRDSGLPLVAMSTAIEGDDVPKVVVQDYEASIEAAQHLIDLGHRQLGYISGPEGNWVQNERWRGFCDGAAEAGLDPASIMH